MVITKAANATKYSQARILRLLLTLVRQAQLGASYRV